MKSPEVLFYVGHMGGGTMQIKQNLLNNEKELIPGDGDGDLRFSELSKADVATQPVSQEKFLICIDGSIGSKKSNFMEYLLQINEKHRQQQVKVIREPLGILNDEMTEFYDALKAGKEVTDEQKELSSRFEKHMFDHHLEVATDPIMRSTHIISERSMAAKIKVFNDLNYEQGRLLESYRDDMQKQYDLKIKGSHEPHVVIFFEIPVRVAMERIKVRGRESEKHITEEYLHAIEKKYQALYPPEALNVIRFNSDQPLEDLIPLIQDKLPEVLMRHSPATQDEIGHLMKFFQDVRGEPCEEGAGPELADIATAAEVSCEEGAAPELADIATAPEVSCEEGAGPELATAPEVSCEEGAGPELATAPEVSCEEGAGPELADIATAPEVSCEECAAPELADVATAPEVSCEEGAGPELATAPEVSCEEGAGPELATAPEVSCEEGAGPELADIATAPEVSCEEGAGPELADIATAPEVSCAFRKHVM